MIVIPFEDEDVYQGYKIKWPLFSFINYITNLGEEGVIIIGNGARMRVQTKIRLPITTIIFTIFFGRWLRRRAEEMKSRSITWYRGKSGSPPSNLGFYSAG